MTITTHARVAEYMQRVIDSHYDDETITDCGQFLDSAYEAAKFLTYVGIIVGSVQKGFMEDPSEPLDVVAFLEGLPADMSDHKRLAVTNTIRIIAAVCDDRNEDVIPLAAAAVSAGETPAAQLLVEMISALHAMEHMNNATIIIISRGE